ncbi:MAG TPA: hypothetical protein ENH82_01660 [bacterium]|nr:hypothetical protein [bacterium]
MSKKKTIRGIKTRAGQLLSAFLRNVAEEKTELIKEAGEEDRIASKAEAMARLMWKFALGFNEVDVKTGKIVAYKPDKAMIALIYDRVEGRSPVAIKEDDGKLTVSERVSEQGKKRISQAGGLSGS